MSWTNLGDWLKKNGGTGAALVGSLLTGNIPGAVAAGVSLVSSATGQEDPQKALESLQQSPETMIKLRELAIQDEASIREHIRLMKEAELKDQQAAHKEQQDTIRSGDNAEDVYVRHTRPMMARQSWFATAGYVVAFEGAKALGYGHGANWELAMLIMSPAAAYIGFRSWDKRK